MNENRKSQCNKETGSRKRRATILVLRIISSVLFVYVASYFLMMNQHCPTYDPGVDNFPYESSYWFADIVRMRGDVSIYMPSECWANRMFWPADWLLHPALEWQYQCLEQKFSPQDENP